MSNYNYGYHQQQYVPNPYAGRGGAQWGRGGRNVNPHPELEAPRRGRGQGRGGYPRQRLQQEPVPAPPAEEQPSGVPLPKHLSKTSSPLTNDPLYLESFMGEMGTEMRKAPVVNETHPGHFGFASVVEEDYKSIASRSHVYAKNVSESMHSYYVGLNLYYRMLDLHRQSGSTLTVDEADFVTQMQMGKYGVTKLIEQYTAGFGNTTIPGSSECSFTFDKPALVAGDHIPGFFGHIAEHPIDYATYVSPGVLAQRIVEDCARTAAPAADDPGDNWQLEVDLPDEDDGPAAPQPNRRCIGWAPRERLRQEMMTALAHARVEPEAFHSDNPSIPYNTRLMNYIHYQLSGVRGYVEGTIPTSQTGSTAQIVTALVNGQDEVSIRAPFSVAGSIAFFASAFRYRVDIRDNPQILAPYNNAPNIVGLERNRLAENPILNEHLYQTIYCNSHQRIKKIVKFNFDSKT